MRYYKGVVKFIAAVNVVYTIEGDFHVNLTCSEKQYEYYAPYFLRRT